MKNRRLDGNLVPSQLRKIIGGMFGLDPGPPTVIPDDEALVGGSFGLDSLDGVELALCIEEEFGVNCGADVLRRGVGSIATLARYICAGGQIIRRQRPPGPRPICWNRTLLTLGGACRLTNS
jgi:acyl carrier protein